MFRPRMRGLYGGKENKGRYCTPACCYAWRRGKPAPHTFRPESTENERVRANGLVNMRLRRGADTRPSNCQKCGRGNCVIDGHHPDYNEPDLIAFLCRSCHMLAHRDRAFEAEVAAIARRVSKTRKAGAA
jgi:hypothetical protein